MAGNDFGREFGQVIASSINDHMALPPRQQNIRRAVMGTGLLTACAYSAWWSKAFISLSAGQLVTVFARSPSQAPSWVWWPVVIWLCAAGLGILWLLVGISNSRGPREIMTIFWCGVRLCIFSALLLFQVYLPRDWNMPLVNLVLQGIYICAVTSTAVDLVLQLIGPPRRSMPANTHGQARVASAGDLKQRGILR